MTLYHQKSTVSFEQSQHRWLIPVLCGALLLGATGCVTLETTEDRDFRMQQMASMNADFRALMEERQKLINMLEANRMETAQLTYQVKDLSQRLDLVEGRFGTVDANYKQALDKLNAAIRNESQRRQDAIKDVVTSVSSEIAKTANQLQAQQQQLLKSMEPSAQGDYVVCRGDTLSAIAKAFGITVESLKKANGMKDANLHVGQKLVIPKQ